MHIAMQHMTARLVGRSAGSIGDLIIGAVGETVKTRMPGRNCRRAFAF